MSEHMDDLRRVARACGVDMNVTRRINILDLAIQLLDRAEKAEEENERLQDQIDGYELADRGFP